jgi:hypothetical protein
VVEVESIAASREGLIVQLIAPARADVSAWADAISAHTPIPGAGARWNLDQPVVSALSSQASARAGTQQQAVRASFRLTRRADAPSPAAPDPRAPNVRAHVEKAP